MHVLILPLLLSGLEALKRVEGSRVRYSEYEGVGHNVWLKVASEPGLLPWLLAQRAD